MAHGVRASWKFGKVARGWPRPFHENRNVEGGIKEAPREAEFPELRGEFHAATGVKTGDSPYTGLSLKELPLELA